jgi:hypothetical protein
MMSRLQPGRTTSAPFGPQAGLRTRPPGYFSRLLGPTYAILHPPRKSDFLLFFIDRPLWDLYMSRK